VTYQCENPQWKRGVEDVVFEEKNLLHSRVVQNVGRGISNGGMCRLQGRVEKKKDVH